MIDVVTNTDNGPHLLTDIRFLYNCHDKELRARLMQSYWPTN